MNKFAERALILERQVRPWNRVSPEGHRSGWARVLDILPSRRRFKALLVGGVALCLIILIACELVGYRIAPKKDAVLAQAVRTMIPAADAWPERDLRVRLRVPEEAVRLVEVIISAPQPATPIAWYARLMGRPAPQIDPGRVANFVQIATWLTASTPEETVRRFDELTMASWFRHAPNIWKFMEALGNLPPESLATLLSNDAAGLEELASWLGNRPKHLQSMTTLKAEIEADQAQAKRQAQIFQSLAAQTRDRLARLPALRRQCEPLWVRYATCADAATRAGDTRQ